MLSLLFDFYYDLFYLGSIDANAELNIFTECGFDFLGNPDYNMSLGNYFAWICSIISLVFLVLLCCWFIKKIIGIIFRLFTGSSSF